MIIKSVWCEVEKDGAKSHQMVSFDEFIAEILLGGIPVQTIEAPVGEDDKPD